MWVVLGHLAPCLFACGPAIPLNEQSANYFGLKDGGEYQYQNESSQEMIHTYERSNDDESFIFFREATQGGFIIDEMTMVVEAVDDGLQINQFYDCLTRCGDPSEPVKMFTWPMEEGDDQRTELTVSVTENGQSSLSREESHRFAVGAETTKNLPIGSSLGFDVIWTRTIDGETDTAALFVVPELGFGELELFSGEKYELASGP